MRRGDPVVVIGKLKTEEWTNGGVRNSRFILEATAVGHDLSRGMSRFEKSLRQPDSPVDDNAGCREGAAEHRECRAPPV